MKGFISSKLKDKIIIYFGSFFSQISTFIITILIVRSSSLKNISEIAILDGFLLFLPFIISLMSERTTIIIFYRDKEESSEKIFSSSLVFTTILFLLSYIVYILIDLYSNYKINSTHMSMLILACYSISVYNICFQNLILQRNYLRLAIIQLSKGSLMLSLACLQLYLGVNTIKTLLLSYLLSNLVSTAYVTLNYIKNFSADCFFSHVKTFLRLGYIPILVVVFSYIISNAGRFVLESNEYREDLAFLLVYSKSLIILMSLFMPLSNYLKPKFLELYDNNRNDFPLIWKSLLYFTVITSLLLLVIFKILWVLWLME